MTQAELGERCGVSQPTVSEWLTGESDPSLKNLRKLSGITGLTIDELLATPPANGSGQPAASAP